MMTAATGAIKLTEGAVMVICKGELAAEKFQPFVQVVDLKAVNTQAHHSSTERFRLLLSDGTHYQQGMLGTQLNGLVKSGKLQKGSIVQLREYVCNPIQDRLIIIVIEMDLIVEQCGIIGEPVSAPRLVPGAVSGNTQSFGGPSAASGTAKTPNVAGATLEQARMNQSRGSSFNNSTSGRFDAPNAPSPHAKSEPVSRFHGSATLSRPHSDQRMDVPRPPFNTYAQQPPLPYQQPPSMYLNRGPVAKNEAPPRLIPIAALNPYQGRWTIKARVTAKGELRFYNNPRGDGKVFSFDLLDSDGGEIRVTCFNTVADQFYNQVEAGKVYMISKGSLKPAQKNFNHLNNDLEIFLDNTSTVQPCSEDDTSIPQQQFHFRPIGDIESIDNNSIVDIIGVVFFISPAASIMRKNGTETQKRSLQLKDMSGRSVELTLWGNFCHAEGQSLQNMCDSGAFPVLAVKSGRVSDFNGKALGTISTSQLFIEPDFPEAHRLREWFEKEGRNSSAISISRELSSVGRTDIRKTLSQIKDERLGTSEKPDWITVAATISFIKVDNFCYTACPIMIGDRQCNKKVTNNGDGKWRCDRCDQTINECDYRYILQLQIQDHTGLTWVTAFQETGEEIIGIPAKNLYFLKYEEQDDEKFAEIIRKVLFTKFTFKLKVKEETFSDEQRVKSTVVKAEKVIFSSESRFLLDLMDKLRAESSGSFASKSESIVNDPGTYHSRVENVSKLTVPVHSSGYSNVGRVYNTPANSVGQFGNQYNSTKLPGIDGTNTYPYCNSCGSAGHSPANCPSIMNSPGKTIGGIYSGSNYASVSTDATGECFKCHQTGHWARDCPGLGTVPLASYGSGFAARR